MSVFREANANARFGKEHLVSRIMNRLATPLTTGLFVISAISGVALFFRWVPGAFHTMHVWLSMVLLVPVVLHVWRNWRSLLGYARRGALAVPLVLCLVAAVPFAVVGLNGGGRRGGNRASRMVTLIAQARLTDLAPVLKTTPDTMLATLRQRGFSAQSAEETLDAVATASGKQPTEVLLAVMPGDSPLTTTHTR